ncbi:MAG: hydrogenase [Ruminococcus sp.]|jgi:nitrogenase molybdenum-iron protein beta chain|nr:hydrogenase [Ruminococcus sp.]
MSNVIEQERFTCAIGAMQSVVAIPRAVPILHSGPGCGNMVNGFFERSAGYAGGSTAPCTNFSEKDVVFGGVGRLRNIIQNTYKVLDTDLQVVLTGCTSGIVGDDVDSVVSEFREEGKPIVSVETAGFKCNNYEAHSLVVNAIIDQYVNEFAHENEPRSEKNTVNLFASLPYQDQFWKGNLREYKRLLQGLGLKVNVLFGSESGGISEWKTIPRANFNILVSPWYGLPIVENLKRKYGQPYYHFPHTPIGANETEKFLGGVINFAAENGAEIDTDKAREFVAHESKSYYEEIDNLATFLLEFRYGLPNYAHIIHDAGYVVGMAKFLLHETGVVPKELFIVDDTPKKFQEGISANLADTSDKRIIPITFEPDAGKIGSIILGKNHRGRGLILGAGWDKDIARQKDCDFLSISVPTSYRIVLTTNYVGFTGGLRLIEDIYNTALANYR